MIQVYKLPSDVNIEHLLNIPKQGVSKLHPIQDANDNWIITIEEYNSLDFQALKNQYKEVVDRMVLIDYIKK